MILSERIMYNDPKELKILLSQLKSNKYTLKPNIDIDLLINGMLENIGSVDAELRDLLIYQAFFHFSIKTNLLNDKFRTILKTSIDTNHLFFKIGEKESDSVFTRSFSVLLIALILYNHREKNIFTSDEIKEIYTSVKNYFIQEKDLRGFIQNKGWAHSVAHTADTIDELALCNELGKKQLKEILDLLKNKTCNSDTVFVYEEDERMVTAVVSVLRRHALSDKEIIEWLNSFSSYSKTGKLHSDMNLKTNNKNFLRSLYFRILPIDEFNHFNQEILAVLTILQKN